MFRAPAAVALFIASLIGVDIAAACSRVLWNDNGQAVLVGRNVDWPQDMQINLWAFSTGHRSLRPELGKFAQLGLEIRQCCRGGLRHGRRRRHQ